MPLQTAATCPHELRPGTAVCLRCQHAERAAKLARQRRLFVRGSAATLVLGAVAAVAVAGASAYRSGAFTDAFGAGARSSMAERSKPTAEPASDTLPADGVPSAAFAIPQGDLAISSAAAEARVAPAALTPPPAVTLPRNWTSPVVGEGRTVLRDTMFAVRAGDTVRVYFDRLMTRTRRADKFEGIVRATLPQVFGVVADSALASMPPGGVALAGDLIVELPARGVRLPLTGGRVIAVWPETRPGRDGPLVASYRAVATR